MIVNLKDGEVEVRKPKAGPYKRAVVKADTPEGMKNSVLMIELLPYCIGKHPWGTTPVGQALDSLDYQEYDRLIEALAKEMTPPEGDVQKKSEQPSERK